MTFDSAVEEKHTGIYSYLCKNMQVSSSFEGMLAISEDIRNKEMDFDQNHCCLIDHVARYAKNI